MHLTRIELENFKSFGGFVNIPLEEGFTGITGPNGSGKSNCGDAIQFVLGPKSTRSLRASNVTELIFNGGGSRKPAKNMSATLVFSNTPESDGRRRLRIETEEVSFTRSVRLNRKGDPISSYSINENPCTATEMRRILAEAGLRGDGYNIVLQGDVTNLATMTPHKRRGILEEVAGVTAYDEEIKKANNQRKKVENSIETIDIFEDDQKKRLKDLGKEREQALKFKDLKDELDEAKITLNQSRFKNKVDELRLLGDERSRYIDEKDIISSELTIGAKKVNDYDEEMVKVSNTLDEMLGGDAKEILDKIKEFEILIESGADRIGDQENKILLANQEINISRKELSKAEKAHKDAEINLTKANKAVSDAMESLRSADKNEKEARKAIQSGDKHGRDLNRQLGQATESENLAQTKYAESQLNYDRAEQLCHIASDKLADLEAEYESVTLDRDDQELLGEDLQEKNPLIDRASLAEDLRKIQKQDVLLCGDREKSEAKLRNSERELEKARARQEAKSSRPGSASTIAALSKLRQSGEISGILGTLGELATPKDPAHESALAHALGGGLRSIVVKNDDVASKCISWLSKNGGGRATFLPLNKLIINRPQGRTLLVARNPGIIGFVHDLLDYDIEIETAIKYAGRNTLIVQNMDIARKNMGGVRMVTIGGSVIESSGAMTGGSKIRNDQLSFGGGSSINNLDKFERAVDEASLIYSTVEAALKELRGNEQLLRAKIHGLDDSDHSVKLRNWKADMERSQRLVTDVSKKLKEARKEFQKLDNNRKELYQECENNNISLKEYKQKRIRCAEDLQNHTPDHLSEILRSAEITRTEAERTMLASDAEIHTGKHTLEILKIRVNDISRQISLQEDILKSSELEIKNINNSINNADKELIQLKAKSSQFDEEQQILHDRRDVIVEERASLRAHVAKLSQDRQTLSSRVDELNSQIKQKGLLVNEMAEELKYSQIALPSGDILLPTVSEAEKSVQGLERRLSHLGDVNMLAIEQYDIAVERIADLISDGKLLRERKTQLISIADQLEKERKTRLLSVFSHVNKNFSRVYEILQPLGHGSLKLENMKNPFEGGLEMACVPPGKSRNTRRTALSGGEKSMAALALIFAIQDYEPSPFYYFDEVDQNLDPFNSERIATLCRMRSKRAQFIMVTLRKVSLTLADHHIGITHAGDGCSRRITDFDRAAALQLGEELEAEQKARAASDAEKEAMPDLPNAENMPRTPEPLSAPKSLGGLVDRAGIENSEEKIDNGLNSLRERTDELSEEIETKENIEILNNQKAEELSLKLKEV
ncbi:MAG: chromosome segregation protein SMC [Marine Group II euryarchaeote MED-G38]|nr:chromosome segregation protein SMC [Euryarchaeota archaeon]OUV25279.1 MAG: chromosome segregation protein SMC [Euryarchaeota archaeon TMED97]PDH21712.1 MAG: chromosome segregation protein SMC [Marine Group II euryarchaeote MED-G38]|tara:strand:- start:6493 stop:10377 length:3885 start_codon:yes stop_codon:yes gene_type:complete